MSITKINVLVLTMIALLSVGCSGAKPAEATKPADIVDADSTARNVRDDNASKAAPIPENQSEEKRDVEITANIRKAVVADKSLSSNAHNVKIITSGGEVALRGPVKSEAEKMSIEAKAKEVAGLEHVHNRRLYHFTGRIFLR